VTEVQIRKSQMQDEENCRWRCALIEISRRSLHHGNCYADYLVFSSASLSRRMCARISRSRTFLLEQLTTSIFTWQKRIYSKAS
jgi:hypothetical protein